MAATVRSVAETLLDASRDAVFAVSPEGTILSWNWGAEVTYSYSAKEAVGASLYDLLVPEGDAEPTRAMLREAVETGSAVDRTRQRRRDGAVLQMDVLCKAVRGDGDRVLFLVLHHRDITEQRRLEEMLFEQNRELQAARQAADAATRAKSEFLATMSHEIRTPMNAVIGMTSLLLDTRLTEEQREFVETIRASGDHLLTVINDILDFSKIESGRMELEVHPFDLRSVVEEALDLVAARAAEKGLELAYLIEPEVPHTLAGDAGRLRQVLVNLLSNGVKFTERGEVVLTVAARRLAGDRHEVHCAVRDTGIGIPPDRLDRLFKPFSQADASTSRTYGGTGLGLAISRRLSELMGGRVWAESEPGKGSTFHATLQADAVAVPVKVAARGPSPQLEGCRVLVVDDNVTNRRILDLYARSWGMLPRVASSGAEALEWVRRGDPFDVGVLDLAMPGMDGIALAREIQRLRPGARLPLVLLSSLGPHKREAAAGGARFAAHLTKPVKQSQLYNTLVEVLARDAHGPRAPPGQAVPVERLAERLPLRILLAEDNAVNQKVALRMLQRLGYQADVAGSGLEALEAVGRQRYDVLLMDVQMPEMDGLEAARRVCARWPAAERPRIVAMTANALAGDRERCLEAGMDDYISKPVDLRQLAAALARCQPRAARGRGAQEAP